MSNTAKIIEHLEDLERSLGEYERISYDRNDVSRARVLIKLNEHGKYKHGFLRLNITFNGSYPDNAPTIATLPNSIRLHPKIREDGSTMVRYLQTWDRNKTLSGAIEEIRWFFGLDDFYDCEVSSLEDGEYAEYINEVHVKYLLINYKVSDNETFSDCVAGYIASHQQELKEHLMRCARRGEFTNLSFGIGDYEPHPHVYYHRLVIGPEECIVCREDVARTAINRCKGCFIVYHTTCIREPYTCFHCQARVNMGNNVNVEAPRQGAPGGRIRQYIQNPISNRRVEIESTIARTLMACRLVSRPGCPAIPQAELERNLAEYRAHFKRFEDYKLYWQIVEKFKTLSTFESKMFTFDAIAKLSEDEEENMEALITAKMEEIALLRNFQERIGSRRNGESSRSGSSRVANSA